MNQPQAGILRENTAYHYHLEYRSLQVLRAPVVAHAHSVAKRNLGPDGQIVVGFRPSLWPALMSWNLDEDSRDFTDIAGTEGFGAPSTQNDVWFWIHSDSNDRNFEAARAVHWAMQQSARLTLEVCGFARHQNRDLTGFIHGSANPQNQERFHAALIPRGRKGAGGSLALTQKWVHDLMSFNTLSIADQEAIIGRTKADGVELEGNDMPADCHVSRMKIPTDDGQIYRRSTAFGSVREHGLFVVAFASKQRYLRLRLQRMFGIDKDALHDRLIHFSRAVSGSYWFVPSLRDLDEVLYQ